MGFWFGSDQQSRLLLVFLFVIQRRGRLMLVARREGAAPVGRVLENIFFTERSKLTDSGGRGMGRVLLGCRQFVRRFPSAYQAGDPKYMAPAGHLRTPAPPLSLL